MRLPGHVHKAEFVQMTEIFEGVIGEFKRKKS